MRPIDGQSLFVRRSGVLRRVEPQRYAVLRGLQVNDVDPVAKRLQGHIHHRRLGQAGEACVEGHGASQRRPRRSLAIVLVYLALAFVCYGVGVWRATALGHAWGPLLAACAVVRSVAHPFTARALALLGWRHALLTLAS